MAPTRPKTRDMTMEYLENMRRTLDRMEQGLTPGKDSDSNMIDGIAHLRDLLSQAQKEFSTLKSRL